jgi:peptidoglycan-N-acetylglucosamine deacetylase
MTFDDGPSVGNTARLLDILKQRNIKVTFFMIGPNVVAHPEIARRVLAEGTKLATTPGPILSSPNSLTNA